MVVKASMDKFLYFYLLQWRYTHLPLSFFYFLCCSLVLVLLHTWGELQINHQIKKRIIFYCKSVDNKIRRRDDGRCVTLLLCFISREIGVCMHCVWMLLCTSTYMCVCVCVSVMQLILYICISVCTSVYMCANFSVGLLSFMCISSVLVNF